MKHILFAISLMVTLAYCTDSASTRNKKLKAADTQYVRIHFATNAVETNAKLILKDTMREVWEYNSDSSERVGKQKRVFDTLWDVRFTDSVWTDTTRTRKRWLDTMIMSDKLYVMRIVHPAWKSDSVVRAEREAARRRMQR